MRSPVELYLARHAQSRLNTSPNIIGGRSNETPLTPLGVRQAKQLGRFMICQNIRPLRIHSSPAVRTRQTAQYSLDIAGFGMEPIIDDDLQEMSQGIYEGLERDKVYTDDVVLEITRQQKNFKLQYGESMNDVTARMCNWANQTAEALPQSDSPEPLQILAYTHGLAIRCFSASLCELSHDEIRGTYIGNASLSKFILDDNGWNMEYSGIGPDGI
ncbi:MAG TPA: histidine phosphatase family protein [Patescibacteria group bacterium]|nr:histidine phosphatase family protein [Patescibacteria group bacterium]